MLVSFLNVWWELRAIEPVSPPGKIVKIV